MKTSNKTNGTAASRKGSGLVPVTRIARGLGHASVFRMTYQNHVEVFDLWRWENGMVDRPLGECLDRYCALLPGGLAIGNVKDFLIDTIRW